MFIISAFGIWKIIYRLTRFITMATRICEECAIHDAEGKYNIILKMNPHISV